MLTLLRKVVWSILNRYSLKQAKSPCANPQACCCEREEKNGRKTFLFPYLLAIHKIVFLWFQWSLLGIGLIHQFLNLELQRLACGSLLHCFVSSQLILKRFNRFVCSTHIISILTVQIYIQIWKYMLQNIFLTFDFKKKKQYFCSLSK